MTTVIRPAQPEDVALILEFIHQLATYEKLPNEVVATVDSLRMQLFPEQGKPSAHCVIAYAGDEPVGFALYFHNFSTWLARRGIYLEDLFVKPNHRGRGHGKALLLHLAHQALAEGCGRMEWSVLDWNQPAIDFYESLGAEIMTAWRTCRLDEAALARLAKAPGSTV